MYLPRHFEESRSGVLHAMMRARPLAIFQGPQAYISPSFYPSKQQTGEVVPTWDYAVVHAHGSLRFVQDAAWLRGNAGADSREIADMLGAFEHERRDEPHV